MTWYAHNIYIPANPTAMELLRGDPYIKPFLFFVKSLDKFIWHTPEVIHSLGKTGLLVIQPVGPTEEHSTHWYGRVLPWDSLQVMEEAEKVDTHVDEDQSPPQSLLQFLRSFSMKTKVPVLFYSCFMWGGDVEFEAAWVFLPEQYTYVGLGGKEPCVQAISDKGVISTEAGDVLGKALCHLGVSLPTSFFALHTRRFDWAEHQII